MIDHLERNAKSYISLAGLAICAGLISMAVHLDNLQYDRVGEYQVRRTLDRTIVRKNGGFAIGNPHYWIDEGNDGTVDRKFIDGDILEEDFQRDLEVREEDNKLVSDLISKLH